MAQAKKTKSSKSTSRKPKASPSASAADNESIPIPNPAETVVSIGTEAMRDFWAGAANGDAKQAQAQAIAFSKDSAESLAKSADVATRSLNESIELSKDNIEACVESSNIAANIGKDISTELYNSASNLFSDSVESSKQLLSCRTINDVFDLQTRLVKQGMENYFDESAKFTELFFQLATEPAEPLNEKAVETTERLTKVLATS